MTEQTAVATAPSAVSMAPPQPAKPERSLTIKGLTPGLPERGKIKIGSKGAMRTSSSGNQYQLPQKLDHFRITTMERDKSGNFVRDEEIHKTIADKPTRIPIRLLFDDIELNFQSRYACFVGRTMMCAGDGETAERQTQGGGHKMVDCTCERIERDYQGANKCKINGTLSVMIDGASGVGGVWKFRTTSFNSVIGITSSLSFIKSVTGGVLAGILLDLVVAPKTVISPTDGKTQTIYVVGVEFPGAVEDLRKTGYDIALSRAETQVKIEHIETEARKFLAAPTPLLPGDDEDDVINEFYPDEAAPAPALVDVDAPQGAGASPEPKAGPQDRRSSGTAVTNPLPGDETITDAHGEVFDPSTHAMGKDGMPATNKDGSFRKRRGAAATQPESERLPPDEEVPPPAGLDEPSAPAQTSEPGDPNQDFF